MTDSSSSLLSALDDAVDWDMAASLSAALQKYDLPAYPVLREGQWVVGMSEGQQ